MATATDNLQLYCRKAAERARAASRQLANLSTEQKNRWLLHSADQLESSTAGLLAANALDLESAPVYGLSEAAIDRLRLTEARIAAMAKGLREIAALPDPVGEVIEGNRRPNGLEISKVRVPLGTVFFIYESRPNVTVDAAAICVKSGNAVILRGGKEAMHSSAALVTVLNEAASVCGIPSGTVQIIETTDRDAVGHLLKMADLIDVAIPRGGKGLIERVVTEARMPVLKHYDGNCHVYIDSDADAKIAEDVLINSKCHRLGVCNACESLLIHIDVANHLLPLLGAALQSQGIEIRGDEASCRLLPKALAAADEDWYTEYLGPIISCKVVSSLQEAIDHINKYGSHHTDAIVSKNVLTVREFARQIDSAAVMVNASTRFNDGGEFGLGAEIGISTDKFHARGPCGLKELTSYKYIVYGSGHVRN